MGGTRLVRTVRIPAERAVLRWLHQDGYSLGGLVAQAAERLAILGEVDARYSSGAEARADSADFA